jgi:MoaA/NifB/PqqE/SkfB family radical SAM enzyme
MHLPVQAVIDICNNYDIKSLMTFGGEPLIYPEVVCNIHKTAKEMNIKDRAIITNGFFSKDKERVREVAQMLSYSGVQKVLLSVDSFHQETIPLDIVKYFAMCIKESGVEINSSATFCIGEIKSTFTGK